MINFKIINDELSIMILKNIFIKSITILIKTNKIKVKNVNKNIKN